LNEYNQKNATCISPPSYLFGIICIFYSICNLFFLGGTLVPIGGHNLLEPAVWSKPSIVGPHHQNCKDIADRLEKENALIKAKAEQELFVLTKKLLKNSKLTKEMGIKAYSWLKREADFVQNKLDILIKELQQI